MCMIVHKVHWLESETIDLYRLRLGILFLLYLSTFTTCNEGLAVHLYFDYQQRASTLRAAYLQKMVLATVRCVDYEV